MLVELPSRLSLFPGNLAAVLAPSRVRPKDLEGFAVPLAGGAVRPRSLGASFVVHVLVVLLLIGVSAAVRRQRALTPEQQAEIQRRKISWYYFADELPAIAPAETEAATESRSRRRSSDRTARQTITSNPIEPDNDHQTILQPDFPGVRITQDVRLPNIVMWGEKPSSPERAYLAAPDVRLERRPDLPELKTERPALEYLPAANIQVRRDPLNMPATRAQQPERGYLPAPDVPVQSGIDLPAAAAPAPARAYLPAPNVAVRQRADLPATASAGAELAYLPAPDVAMNDAPKLALPVPGSGASRPAPPVDLVKREVSGLRVPGLGGRAVEPPPPDITPVPGGASRAAGSARALAAGRPGALPPDPQPGGGAGAGSDVLPLNASAGGMGRLIALSKNPAPASDSIVVPAGNRRGRFTVTTGDGEPGDEPGAGGGNGAGTGGAGDGPGGSGGRAVADLRVPGISITGGVRPPPASVGPVVSGPAGPASPTRPRAPAGGTEQPNQLATLMAREARPGVRLPEIGMGARQPEREFRTGKKIYTAYINMPNVTSRAGSWVMRFAELAEPQPGASGDLTAPVAIRKVDPPYHPDALRERVEGIVVLYAVILRDGSVESVRVVRGLDPRLDDNAMKALRGWRFQPATRNGAPVDLEALVQIPFAPSLARPF